MAKEIKKFDANELDKVLSSVNAGRGRQWMAQTIRDLVKYVKWVTGQSVK